MDKQRYIISDAAAIVSVESHVLRYWEDELELVIPRNEMGHRYYTKENIDQFMKIKELKEQGYQLKAIKMILHNQDPNMLEAENQQPVYQNALQQQSMKPQLHQPENVYSSNQNRLDQFQVLMTQIVKEAIQENNRALGKEVGEEVGVRVIKEMNYLMREQDEQAEDRYRKLNEAIRSTYKKKEKSGKLFGKKNELKPKEA